MIMSLQQAKFIKRASRGVEAFSLGHNPWTKYPLFSRHIALPVDTRPVFLSEVLCSDHGGGMHPEECMHKFATSCEGGHGLAKLEIPNLSLGKLKELTGGMQSIPASLCLAILTQILTEQQDDLGIKVWDMDIASLVPKPKKAAAGGHVPDDAGGSGGLPKSRTSHLMKFCTTKNAASDDDDDPPTPSSWMSLSSAKGVGKVEVVC